MSRLAVMYVALAGCARDPEPPPPPPPPVADVVALAPQPSPADAAAPADAASADEHHRLRASEGTLAITPLTAVTTEHAATATLTLTAAAGFRVNADFPVRLSLVPPEGIAIAKPDLTRADAAVSDDQHLVLPVELVAHEPGSYAVTGSFKFALCQRDVCFAKDEPISIAFAATAAAP